MIPANIVGLETSMDLETGVLRGFVILEVNGERIRAEMPDEAHVTQVLRLTVEGVSSGPQDPEPLPARVDVPPPPTVVNWRQDPRVPRIMNAALQMLNVPDELPEQGLQELLRSIQAEFTEEDWAQVHDFMGEATPPPQRAVMDRGTFAGDPLGHGPPPQLVPQPPQQPAAPPAPADGITWASGAPMFEREFQRRTVESDDYGYPIVAQTGVDPGEAGNFDLDEDGAPQI